MSKQPITPIPMESLKKTFFTMLRARMRQCKKELATVLETSEYVELTKDGFKWSYGHFSFHAYRSMQTILCKENDLCFEALYEEPEFEMCLNQVIKQCYLDKVDNEMFMFFFDLLIQIMSNNSIKRRTE